MAKIIALFSYTGDNEQWALDEIKNQITSTGLTCVSIDVTDSKRACRNAYGKKLTEDEFDEIDPDSDEAWFDDYDFNIQTVITSDDKTLDEIKDLIEDIDEFDEFIEAS